MEQRQVHVRTLEALHARREELDARRAIAPPGEAFEQLERRIKSEEDALDAMSSLVGIKPN
jgi:hypothetical protein